MGLREETKKEIIETSLWVGAWLLCVILGTITYLILAPNS